MIVWITGFMLQVMMLDFGRSFYSSGVMGLGWDFWIDLEQYENRTDVEKLSRNIGMMTSAQQMIQRLFGTSIEIKTGDIVYAKVGVKRIVGRGVVTGDYYFDVEFQNISIVIPLIGRVKVLGICENKSHKKHWLTSTIIPILLSIWISSSMENQ